MDRVQTVYIDPDRPELLLSEIKHGEKINYQILWTKEKDSEKLSFSYYLLASAMISAQLMMPRTPLLRQRS